MTNLLRRAAGGVGAAVVFLWLAPAVVWGGEGVRVTKLAVTSTTTDGAPIRYPAGAPPEVTAAIVEIPPGGETGWHQHAVPLYAYVLSGNLEVRMGDGKIYPFKEGDPIIEVVGTPHNGRNVGSSPVRLVVFYTGEKGVPNAVAAPPPAGAAPAPAR